MFINFAKRLFEILVSDEFSYIKQADNRLVYDTDALALYKDKGSILYVVAVINAEMMSEDKYEALNSRFSGLLDNSNKAVVLLINVIVNDSEKKLAVEEDYLPGKKSYVFSYNVDLERGEVDAPDEQPELLGMKSKIEAAVDQKGEEYVNGTHLTSLEYEVYEKYSLPEKSGNIRLTYALITVCIIVWALTELSGGSNNIWTLASFGAVSRSLVLEQGEYYRLFTAMFLHAGIAHLANNCLALYIFGSRVERYFGKYLFMVIYILSGIVGNAATVFFMSEMSVGASGAVFGLLGALLSITYRTGRSVGDLSPYILLLLCISSIGMGFAMPAVNNFAHVSGFLTGVVLGRIFYKMGRGYESAEESRTEADCGEDGE